MKRAGLISIFVLAIFALFVTCGDPDGGTSNNGYTYTVTFDKNHSDEGGFTEADPQTKTVKSPATTIDTLPTAPERENYKFNGWNDGNGDAFTEETPVTANITVYAQWTLKLEEGNFAIEFELTGNVDGDSVTASPEFGKDGDTITINYTLANDKINNRLVFSGTTEPIEEVDEPGTGTREYTVNEEDADPDGTITITATFTHTDKNLDKIEFTESIVNKTYGDAAFTITVSNSGTGSRAITYSSGHTDIATVNASTGQVTIVKVGSTSITATKAGDDEYEETTANYALHIAQLQLTIGAPTGTMTKTYDGTTTATGIVAGSLTNKVGTDDVTVTVASATYNSANVADANKITVTYSISGADAGNYIKPVDSEITTGVSITKAAGATVAAPTVDTITHGHIAVHAVTPPTNGQTVEYAISETTTEPTENWQDAVTFTGLTGQTDYYVFARAKENANYNAGTAAISAKITTHKEPDPGATLSGTVTVYQLRHNSVRINLITKPEEQTVEYAVSTESAAPDSGWQDGNEFTGLTANTAYYAYARSKANVDYLAGEAISGTFTTKAAPTVSPLIVDFETPVTVGGIRGSQSNGTTTAQATIVADPVNSGEKSLNVVLASGNNSWNTGAYVLVELPTDLSNFESFSFRFYLPNASTDLSANPFKLYVGPSTMNTENQFIDNNNGANYLLGTGVNPSNATGDRDRWIDYEIAIVSNLPSGSQGLTSGTTIKLVIGPNTQNGTTYLLDDLTFTAKPGTVMQSSISPTTATFVKANTSDLYADIDVKMNLYGNTLTGITGGSPAIGAGDYTVSGSTVTLKKEYLAGLLPDPDPNDENSVKQTNVTLTFNFNQGNSRSIVINIFATDADLPVLAYDFSTNPDGKWNDMESAPDDRKPTITYDDTNNALLVTLAQPGGTNMSGVLILTFKLGATTLSEYQSITVNIAAGNSGGASKNNFVAEVAPSSGVFGGTGQSSYPNTRIGTTNNGGTGGTVGQFASRTIPLNLTNTTGTPGALTGDVKIAFGIGEYVGNGSQYLIKSVTLNK
jgi:uncharacterized repeat protein (TIGR02543 family)